MGFGGFDFSDVFSRAARPAERGAGAQSGSAPKAANFQDIFSQWFGRATARKAAAPRAEKGSDLEYGLNIDFWQAIKGTQVRLNITRQEICAACGGTGAAKSGRQYGLPGMQRQRQRDAGRRRDALQPDLPALQRNRTAAEHVRHLPRRRPHLALPKRWRCASRRARSKARGCASRARATPGTQGAPAGDLYITVRVEPHPFFRREGDDIEITVPVRIDEAGLGAKIEVPTIDGRALLKIPQGTKNGQKFRLREKGVLNSRTNKRGDQIVEVQLEAPVVQDERTKELLREYAKLHPEDPREPMWSKV